MLQGTQYCLIRKYVPMRPPSGKVWGLSIQWWVFLYASSTAYKVLNTWPVLLFVRYMDLPWTRSTNTSSLASIREWTLHFPDLTCPSKSKLRKLCCLGKKKKRYSLLGKLKSASYQNVSLEKIMHWFYWPPIYLIPVSYFLMPLTHSLEQRIQQATL